MRQVLPVRKAFLVAALIFLLDFVFGTVVAIQLHLSDPAIGGAARDHWFTAGTPLSAPGVFMIPYVIFLVLAIRKRWMGVIGIAGVSFLTLISGLSWVADLNSGLLPRLIENHLNVFTGFSLVVLAVTTLTVVVLGIVALLLQGRIRIRAALP